MVMIVHNKLGQRERIRTSDPYHPKVVRYQAALHAEVLDYIRANFLLRCFRGKRPMFKHVTNSRYLAAHDACEVREGRLSQRPIFLHVDSLDVADRVYYVLR